MYVVMFYITKGFFYSKDPTWKVLLERLTVGQIEDYFAALKAWAMKWWNTANLKSKSFEMSENQNKPIINLISTVLFNLSINDLLPLPTGICLSRAIIHLFKAMSLIC